MHTDGKQVEQWHTALRAASFRRKRSQDDEQHLHMIRTQAPEGTDTATAEVRTQHVPQSTSYRQPWAGMLIQTSVFLFVIAFILLWVCTTYRELVQSELRDTAAVLRFCRLCCPST